MISLGDIRRSTFLRQNFVLLVGTVLVGFGNYLYYPVLARLLEPAAYGEVQALVALFAQMLILLSVLGQVTINIVANHAKDKAKQAVIYELEKFAFLLTLGLSAILLAFSWQLKSFFQFESIAPFILLLVATLVSVPGAFRQAYLRAYQEFVQSTIAQVIASSGKVVLSAGLVLLGMQSAGAIGGIVVAQFLGFLYVARWARKYGFAWPKGQSYVSKPDLTLLKPELKYAVLVLIGSGAITLLSSIDIFVVKHYFDPTTAGIYAAVSAVSKMIFFLAASVASVMLPNIKLKNSAKVNRNYLVKSMILTVGIGGVVFVPFVLFPEAFVELFMGAKYLEYAHLLPGLAVAMLLLSVVNVVIIYYLALRRYASGAILVVSLLGVMGLFAVHHSSLESVVTSLIIGVSGILCAFGIWRLVELFFKRTRAEATS